VAGLARLMEEVKADEILRFVDPVVVDGVVAFVVDRLISPSRTAADCGARDGMGPLIL